MSPKAEALAATGCGQPPARIWGRRDLSWEKVGGAHVLRLAPLWSANSSRVGVDGSRPNIPEPSLEGGHIVFADESPHHGRGGPFHDSRVLPWRDAPAKPRYDGYGADRQGLSSVSENELRAARDRILHRNNAQEILQALATLEERRAEFTTRWLWEGACSQARSNQARD